MLDVGVLLQNKNIENKKIEVELRAQLINDCLPWKELFFKLKKGKLSKIDKEIVEYEISSLYLENIASGKVVKNIKLELAW